MWATKYRPTEFQHVLGQKIAKRIIDGAFSEDVFPRAWLIYGAQGLGKTTIARIVASRLLGVPTDQLSQNPNYFEHNAAVCSHVDVLDGILSTIEHVPVGNSRYRVVIIDEAHDLSSVAKDRLLRYLEEEVGDVVFLLLTTELDKLKPTIRSRCLPLQIKPVSTTVLMDRLKTICDAENVQYDETALYEIANKSQGFIREAIRTLEQVVLASDGRECRYEYVKYHFGMDLEEVAAELLMMLGDRSEEIPSFLRSNCVERSPGSIWDALMNLLVTSFAAKSFGGIGTEVHRTILGNMGEDIAPLVEWCLTFGTKMGIHSVTDLLAGIGYLRQKLKFTVPTATRKTRRHSVSRQSLSRLQCKLDKSDEVASYEEIKGTLGMGPAGTATT